MSTENSPDRTLILMADNRNPTHYDLSQAPYYSLATVINYQYASRHGYSFYYYMFGNHGSTMDAVDKTNRCDINAANETNRHDNSAEHEDSRRSISGLRIHLNGSYMRGRLGFPWTTPISERWISKLGWRYRDLRKRTRWQAPPSCSIKSVNPKLTPSCVHRNLGDRAASWCRLPILDEVMRKDYDTIVYIDTDAFFNKAETSVSEFLAASRSTLAPIETSTLTLVYNFPWMDLEATAGFMIWRNSDLARQIVRDWWDHDAGKYHMTHDFEQYTLNKHILSESTQGFRDHVAIIPEVTFRERKNQYLRHIAEPDSRLRVPRMRYSLGCAQVRPSDFHKALAKISQYHLIKIDTSVDRISNP